jgi:hypothetical protein
MKPFETLSDPEFIAAARRAVRTLADAPEDWQKAAIGLWPAAPSIWAQAAGAVLRTLQAALSFDSWAQPAPALGMRSTATELRHLLYSVDGRDIDLRLVPAGADFSVSGQVLGPDEHGVIELASDGQGSRMAHVAALDALGEFRIDGVRAGHYVMTLRLGGDEIILPAIEVGERRR